MSIFIETVYPCSNCNEEIDPSHSFCPNCGSEQTPLKGRLHYNIFYRWQGSKRDFKMRYAGHILELEDAQQLAQQTVEAAINYEVFIGAYNPENMKGINDYTTEVQVENWIEVTPSGQLLPDQGAKTVTVTHLE